MRLPHLPGPVPSAAAVLLALAAGPASAQSTAGWTVQHDTDEPLAELLSPAGFPVLSIGCSPGGEVFLDPHIQVIAPEGRRVAFTVDGRRMVREAAFAEDPMNGLLHPFVTVAPTDPLMGALANGRTVTLGLDPDAPGLDDTHHPLAGAREALGEALAACQ